MARIQNDKNLQLPSDRQLPKVYLTYKEAAWSTGLSIAKLYRLVSEGRIPVVKIGGNTLLRPKDLEAFGEKHLVLKNQGR